MMQIHFKNLAHSDIAETTVLERLTLLTDKFPDLRAGHLKVTLEMHNSPHKSGRDCFTIQVFIRSGRYRGVRMTKSAANLYVALADLVEHMLEKLNRFGDRHRVKARRSATRLKRTDRLLGVKPA